MRKTIICFPDGISKIHTQKQTYKFTCKSLSKSKFNTLKLANYVKHVNLQQESDAVVLHKD